MVCARKRPPPAEEGRNVSTADDNDVRGYVIDPLSNPVIAHARGRRSLVYPALRQHGMQYQRVATLIQQQVASIVISPFSTELESSHILYTQLVPCGGPWSGSLPVK
jgi:hypothetical protein